MWEGMEGGWGADPASSSRRLTGEPQSVRLRHGVRTLHVAVDGVWLGRGRRRGRPVTEPMVHGLGAGCR